MSLRSRSRAAFAAAAGGRGGDGLRHLRVERLQRRLAAPRGDFFGSVADAGRCANALPLYPLTVDCGGRVARRHERGLRRLRRAPPCRWIDAAYRAAIVCWRWPP